MTKSEEELEIEISNLALMRCYKKFSRAMKYLPDLPDELRKKWMINCIAEQVELLKARAKNEKDIALRKSPEEMINERNRGRLEEIKMRKLMDESLVDWA